MGKAIVITSANYSGSGLGSVTFVEDDSKKINRIVSAYTSKISSVTGEQTSSIKTLVTTLLAQGLWDKVEAIYPMIGSTIEDKKLNIKGSEYPLSIGSHGTAYDKGVHFSSVDYSTYTIPSDVVGPKMLSTKWKCVFARMNANEFRTLSQFIEGTEVRAFANSNLYKMGASGGKSVSVANWGSLKNVSWAGKSTTQYGIGELGELTYEGYLVEGLKENAIMPCYIGSMYQNSFAAAYLLFVGDCECYALAQFDTIDEYRAFDTAMNAFCDAIK